MRQGFLILVLMLPLVFPAFSEAQGETPLTAHITAVTWSYGPETWKMSPGSIDGPDDLVLGQFNLGTQLSVGVDLARRGEAVDPAWDYAATLTDGLTQMDGKVTAGVETGSFLLQFDVDGTSSAPGAAAVEPLIPGTWTLRIDATSADGPEGFGLAWISAHENGFRTDRAGIMAPQSVLPFIQDIGAGQSAWMPLSPIHSDVTIEVHSESENPVHWSAWKRLTPTNSAPLASLATWAMIDLGQTTWEQSKSALTLDVERLGSGLWVLSGLQAGSLATTILVPVGTEATVESVLAPEPGNPGTVDFTLNFDGADVIDLTSGTAYAIKQSHIGTRGNHESTRALDGSVLVQSPLIPANRGLVQASLDTTLLRSSNQQAYAFLALLLDAAGDYVGHGGHLRGIIPEFAAPSIQVNTPGTVPVVLQHANAKAEPDSVPPGLALDARIQVTADGAAIADDTVSIPNGGTLTHHAAIRPKTVGHLLFEVDVDTGDLQFQVAQSASVGAQEDKNAPSPSVVLMLVGVAFSAFLLRNRDIAD